MFKAMTRGSVRLVERYLPDPYIFVILLTLIAGIAAMAFEQRSPMEIIQYWGNGFWGLLTFAMQMLLVLLTGHMLASTPLVKSWLRPGLAGPFGWFGHYSGDPGVTGGQLDQLGFRPGGRCPVRQRAGSSGPRGLPLAGCQCLLRLSGLARWLGRFCTTDHCHLGPLF